MAFWSLVNGKQVHIYTYEGGKQRRISRKLTKSLDGQSEDVIKAWIAVWEAQHKKEELSPGPLSDARLTQLLEDFLVFASSPTSKQRDVSTVEGYRNALGNHVIPYFLEHGLKDVQTWPSRCVKLMEGLRSKGLSDPLILKCCTALNQFWGWLQDEHLVPPGVTLRLRKPAAPAKDTPLKRLVEPGDVLGTARTLKEDLELAMLIGYFFSLRTQEIFALRRSDFVGAEKAETLECCRVMARAGLFSRLAVNVVRQRSKVSGKMNPPKSGSGGWVACFNRDAAARIVGLINTRCKTPGDLLFAKSTDYYMKRWRREGLTGVTLKDLRRASLYWLGHHTPLGTTALKNHARHALLSTTSLYVRRPGEEIVGDGGPLAI
jgi:hypothetical protein